MMIHTEIEQKFSIEIQNFTSLKEKLSSTASLVDEKRQIDRYFDKKDGELFTRGIFIRIRRNRFQVKFNLNDVLSGRSSGHNQCSELDLPLLFPDKSINILKSTMLSLSIDLPEEIISPFDIFDCNEMIESMVIDKNRTEFEAGRLAISMDEVSGLGQYVEVEANEDIREFSSQEKEVVELVSNLVSEEIDTGYNALYWRIHDYQLYLQSPYVMKKDLQ